MKESKDRLLTLPNLLTLARIVLVCFVLVLVLNGTRFWAGLLLFTACITDILDGWIARRWHQESDLGALLDPVADRVLIFSVFVVLAFIYQYIWIWWVVVYGAMEFAWGVRALSARRHDSRLKIRVNSWGKARMIMGGGIVLLLLFYPMPASIGIIINGALMPTLVILLFFAIKKYNQQIKKS